MPAPNCHNALSGKINDFKSIRSIESIDSVCQVTNAEALFSIKQLAAYFQFGGYGDVLRTMEKSVLRKLPSDRKSDSGSDTEAFE